MNTDTVSVVLPFAGFYGSLWDLDSEHESEAYNLHESDPRLSESEYSELLFRHTRHYRDAMNHVAREYAKQFAGEFEDRAGLPLPLEFEDLVSPREYNFSTDRIFVRAPVDAVRDIVARVVASGDLARVAADTFRARSGFIPFSEYKGGDIAQWPADPAEWDHNMLACAIRAALPDESESDYYGTIEYAIYEALSEAGDLDNAFGLSIDWPAFESAVAEAIAEKEGAADASA